MYQGKPDEVIALLDGQDNEAFAARYSETRGDAYVALERPDDAREAYQAALLETTPTVDQGLVQLKLMDLPREGAVTDTSAEPDMAAEPEADVETPTADATPDESAEPAEDEVEESTE